MFYTIKSTTGRGEWERVLFLQKTDKTGTVWTTDGSISYLNGFKTESAAKAALTRYAKLYPMDTDEKLVMCRGFYAQWLDDIMIFPMYEMEV